MNSGRRVGSTLVQLDYTYSDASKIINYYEWQGNLVMFGSKAMLLLTIPPALEAPQGMKLGYQTVGTLNQTYSFSSLSVIYVLPLNDLTNSLALLTSRVLLGEPSPSSPAHRLLPVFNMTHLFIEEVEIGSPILQFERYSDDTLLEVGEVEVDVYYNEYPHYSRVRYVVGFDFYRPDSSIALKVSLLGILIVFGVILSLCIAKSRKAMAKPQAPEPAFSEDKTEPLVPKADEQLLNTHIPQRLRERGWTN